MPIRKGMRRLLPLLLFVFLTPIPCFLSPAGEEADWSDILAREGQDGRFELDGDIDGKPDLWLQYQDKERQFRHFGVLSLAKWRFGDRSVSLTMNGTSVAIETRNPIPIDPSYSYLIEGWTKLERMKERGGASGVAVVWLDGEGKRLGVLRVHQEAREGEWPFAVGIHDIPREARFAAVRLEALQTPLPGLGPSIQGSVLFDEIRFYRRPRSEVSLSGSGALFWAGEDAPLFTTKYWRLPDGDYRLEQEVLDFRGGAVAQEKVEIRAEGGHLERSWAPRDLPKGWFQWSTRFYQGETLLVRRDVPFSVLSNDEGNHAGYGIDCDRSLEDLPAIARERIPQLRPSFVKIPLLHGEEHERNAVQFLKRLKLGQIDAVGTVSAPEGRSLLEWIEKIDETDAGFFRRASPWIDGWLLLAEPGTDPRDPRWNIVRSRLQPLLPPQARALRLGAQHPFLPEGFDFWALPDAAAAAVPPERADRYVVTIRGGTDPAGGDGFSASAISDFIRRVTDLKHRGTAQLAIPAAGPGGAWTEDGRPTPYLAAWNQVQTLMQGARAWREAQPTLPSGAGGWIFEKETQLVIVIWSRDPIEWEINLGAGVIAQDLMGNPLPVRHTDKGSVFRIGPEPIYIHGVDREVIRTLLSIQADPYALPAREGALPLKLRFTNHFSHPMHGSVRVSLGADWRTEHAERIYSLSPGETWEGTFLTYPSDGLVTEGRPQPLEVNLSWRSQGREQALVWKNRMTLQPDGFLSRYSVVHEEGSDTVEVFHEILSRSPEPILCASAISVPGRQRQWLPFGVIAPGGRSQVVHRISRADYERGAVLTMRETRGRRRFWSVRVAPGEEPLDPNATKPGFSLGEIAPVPQGR